MQDWRSGCSALESALRLSMVSLCETAGSRHLLKRVGRDLRNFRQNII